MPDEAQPLCDPELLPLEAQMDLNQARAWLADLAQAVIDGDLTQYQADCRILSAILRGGLPPEVVQYLEESKTCQTQA
jgi:hypothetical protein